MTLTATEAALLGLLRKGEMSGYDLRKLVERSVGYYWAPAKTQIYLSLPRLVESGLATRRTVRQTERPDKHLYAITDAGREAVSDWVRRAPLDAGLGRNVLLLKLAMADESHAGSLLEQVRERQAEAQRLREELVALEASGGEGDPPFEHLTRRYGFFHIDALLAWLDEVVERLAATLPTDVRLLLSPSTTYGRGDESDCG
jgi:PadR family transcriptional regulator, regulatory protein AphA